VLSLRNHRQLCLLNQTHLLIGFVCQWFRPNRRKLLHEQTKVCQARSTFLIKRETCVQFEEASSTYLQEFACAELSRSCSRMTQQCHPLRSLELERHCRFVPPFTCGPCRLIRWLNYSVRFLIMVFLRSCGEFLCDCYCYSATSSLLREFFLLGQCKSWIFAKDYRGYCGHLVQLPGTALTTSSG
jgi:hypothetical protein